MKKNQVIITALSIMIAVAGYLNFSGRDLSLSKENLEVVNMDGIVKEAGEEKEMTMDISDGDENSKDVVKTGAKGNKDDEKVSVPVADSGSEKDTDIGEAVLTEAKTADFATKAKLEREQTRAKSKEMLMTMIDNDKMQASSRKEAEQKVMQLTANMEMETQIEQLLGAKGFANSVVSISNGSTDVLVAKSALTDVEKAQVEDIVMRKTGMDMSTIVISTMKNQK